MNDFKLKTAILGLNEGGRLLLEAAKGVDSLQIEAVADKDPNLAEKIAGQCECAAYDDYRQLVIQNQLDCLLVAEAMHSCEEYVRVAMKKKFNVLKLPPGARDFEEAAEFVRLSEEEDIQFAVATPSRFARSFAALRRFLEEGKIEQVFLVTALCNVGDYEQLGWHSDPKLAGGGVLLHNCYRMIDQIVWNFGMPQQIYSLNTNQAQDKQQRLYLTEDTAVVTMKFSDISIGNLVASRRAGIGPAEELLKIYGKDRVLTVNDTQLTLSDSLGQTIEQLKCDDSALDCMTELLKNFAQGISSPDEKQLGDSGSENLENMAVIEAAYLSARTGFPEEPGRFLQMAPLPAEKTTSE
ncbi:MAG: Gfo/Idh/MocA family protein [Planctomycetota bacterium]|jgi:predicted dehydrogenase